METAKESVRPVELVTEVELGVTVTPAGAPLTLKFTVPLKVPNSVTVTLLVPVFPCTTLTGVPVIENPLPTGIGGNAFWTYIVNSAGQKVPAEGEFAIALVDWLLANALE